MEIGARAGGAPLKRTTPAIVAAVAGSIGPGSTCAGAPRDGVAEGAGAAPPPALGSSFEQAPAIRRAATARRCGALPFMARPFVSFEALGSATAAPQTVRARRAPAKLAFAREAPVVYRSPLPRWTPSALQAAPYARARSACARVFSPIRTRDRAG